MAKVYPWTKHGFETGEPLEHGLQGVAYRVRRVTDPPEQYGYVAKKLRRQDDDNRRALFFNEVEAMSALEHVGVVKLEETNAQNYRDRSVELFLITEAISGTDLEKAVQAGSISFTSAVQVTLGVLDILQHCHLRGVLHRDIKPCHVILRNNAPTDPVLIDFGIAYSPETQPHEAATPDHGARGNSFLIGPEHAPGNPAVNRTAVTDICQCLGLLFFAVTKQFPRSLRDTESKKPHERLPGGMQVSSAPNWKVKKLTRIFDTGFNWEPSRRWQTIGTLSHRLQELLGDSETVETDFDAALDGIVARAEASSHVARSAEAQRMAKDLVEMANAVVKRANIRLEKFATASFSAFGGVNDKLVLNTVVSMQVKYPPHANKIVRLGMRMLPTTQVEVFLGPWDLGDQPIVEGPQVQSLGIYDLGFPEFADRLRPLLEKHLEVWAAELLGVQQ